MKQIKRSVALLVAFMMVFALAACGGSSDISQTEPGLGSSTSSGSSSSGGTLNVVATSENYVTLFNKFTEETGITVEFLSMSSGEVISKLKAEGGAPMADLWFGGGIDAFMTAKEDGLLEQMSFDTLSELSPEFIDSDHYWIAKGVTVVGLIVNNAIVEEEGLTIPQSWADLTDPSYKGEILMSNPAISGTNYAVVNAILQQKGEEEGWVYFEALNENIIYYSKRGADPLTKTSAGEVAIGITYLDRSVDKAAEEQDLTVVYPTDGIPYVPEGVAVFAGAPNSQNAHAFVEWLFSSDENLILLADIDGKDTIAMVKPGIEGLTLTFDTSLLMEEDLSLFGSMRTEILEKWEVMIGDKAEA